MASTTALPSDPAALLDVQQVADLLSCSPRTVWRLRDAGGLPAAVKVGHLVRWRRDALLKWFEEATETRRR